MKYIFAFLIFLHGAIHLMGFAKAFNYAAVSTIHSFITKPAGIFWLFTFLVFIAAGISYLAHVDWWYWFAFIAVLLSTVLIITVWNDAKFGTIANAVILTVARIDFGTASFYRVYLNEVDSAINYKSDNSENLLTEADLVNLPGFVQNYIRYTGSVGKPKVSNFKVEFTGKIRKNEQSDWMSFVSEQYNFMDSSKRLFFMKAVMKGLPVAGFHCFNNGDAFMDIRLFSLFKVQYQAGKEMDIAETVTFFNDMCCMAPATLIDKRNTWLESDSCKVHARFTINGISISAWLYFNEKGQLTNFVSDDRFAACENNTMKKNRWSTPMKNYRLVNGYRLVTSADAIYSYPEGDFCYGTFSLARIKYNSP